MLSTIGLRQGGTRWEKEEEESTAPHPSILEAVLTRGLVTGTKLEGSGRIGCNLRAPIQKNR